jgi:hypothetical protein
MYQTTPDPCPEQGTLFPTARPAVHRPYRIPAYRVQLVRERALPWERAQLRSSKDVAALFRTYVGDTAREHFLVAMLDQKNWAIGVNRTYGREAAM